MIHSKKQISMWERINEYKKSYKKIDSKQQKLSDVKTHK